MKKNISIKLLSCYLILMLVSCTEEPVKTISIITPPANGISSEPNLHLTQDGVLFLSWIESNPDTSSTLWLSQLENEQWTTPKLIAQGKDWFVNWADFPAITSFGDGKLAAHYLDKSADDTYAYDVKLTLSDDNGKTWGDAFTPHDDGTPTEHGFVSKLALDNDRFLAVWLDGRHMAHTGQETAIMPAMTLRSAIVAADGSISDETLLDNRVCDCCQTDAAMTAKGPIVVYRDRSETEIRDIAVIRKIDGQWTKPQPIFNDRWEIAGCPVNGPAITSLNSSVAVAWFTMAHNVPKVKVAFSMDNGVSFGQPMSFGEDPLGRVDIEFINENTALVTWMDIVDNKTVIQLQSVFSNGTSGKLITLSETSKSRSSGFPRMAVRGNYIYMAWTDTEIEHLRIKTAAVNIATLMNPE
jgi:hypothetical protein